MSSTAGCREGDELKIPPGTRESPSLLVSITLVSVTAAWIAQFAWLAVENHRNFGTWSYDLGIYDQGFWLVSSASTRPSSHCSAAPSAGARNDLARASGRDALILLRLVDGSVLQ